MIKAEEPQHLQKTHTKDNMYNNALCHVPLVPYFLYIHICTFQSHVTKRQSGSINAQQISRTAATELLFVLTDGRKSNQMLLRQQLHKINTI